MKLLLDIGNSRIKLATLTDDGLVVYEPLAVTSDCHARLQQLITPLADRLAACVASSVASQALNGAVEQVIAPLPIHWARSQREAGGIVNGYPDPTQLGVDRWVSMLGLAHHFAQPHPPLVLASFGTATTIDTLSPENRFEGGLILPGITMMHQALARGTANLPESRGALDAFPTNTVSAISSGVVAAQVGAVARQMVFTSERFDQTPILCVTGGARDTLMQALAASLPDHEIRELPHIVLEGLGVLATKI
ncbi:MAG TPA: type III pantothenate kinase [Orrella sp.]